MLGTMSFMSSRVSAASTNQLKLAHGSYIYNKSGKRLNTYRGSTSNIYFKKGSLIKFSGSIKSIKRNSKRYFLLDDDNYNQSWLPYKKINGKYYYSIGSGGYIRASNVSQVANRPLYVSQATVTLAKTGYKGTITVGFGKDQKIFREGQKVTIDRTCKVQYDPSAKSSYRIKGTKVAFMVQSLVKKKPYQKLLTYTYDTYVLINKGTNVYDINGRIRFNRSKSKMKALTTFSKGDKVPIDEMVYIWLPNKNKAELFYHLVPSSVALDGIVDEKNRLDGLSYIKATSANSYTSGPKLTPINTPQQAENDAKIANTSDKEELKKLIDEGDAILNSKSYRNSDTYKYVLNYAKDVFNSNTSTIISVKQATRFLKQQEAVELMSDVDDSVLWHLSATMPE